MSAADLEPGRAVSGKSLAIAAEMLYLANLMLLPGIAFLVLAGLYWRRIGAAPPLAACHLRQVFSASLWAGALLVLAIGLIIIQGGLRRARHMGNGDPLLHGLSFGLSLARNRRSGEGNGRPGISLSAYREALRMMPRYSLRHVARCSTYLSTPAEFCCP